MDKTNRINGRSTAGHDMSVLPQQQHDAMAVREASEHAALAGVP